MSIRSRSSVRTVIGAVSRMTGAALVITTLVIAQPAAAAGPAGSPTSGGDRPNWSIRMLDGADASTGGLFGDDLIVPSGSVSGGYVIEHDRASGPLDIRARALSEPTPFENDLHLTFSTDAGLAPTTVALDDLVRDGGVVRVADSLDGTQPLTIGITATFVPGSQNETRMQRAEFAFVFTLSGDEIVVPPTPGGGPGALPDTGVDIGSGAAAAVGAVLLGVLLLGAVPRRRGGPPRAEGRSARTSA